MPQKSPREILEDTKVIALVGASAKPERPSNMVMGFLQSRGYRVIPVNPGLAGQTLLGEKVYADLSSIPDDIDMIDIFRQSDAVPPIVDEALARWPDLQTVWMQQGVINEQAAKTARDRGVQVVMDRCPKIELRD